ncbi:MAG: hypothetical protein KDI08_02525, partial [Pseudomonadales bacterium]|nr:hypothetical protein [Pseudomonadales bacterium]
HGISVLMAVSDAVAACGSGAAYADLDAPATPERILAAVARQRGSAWAVEPCGETGRRRPVQRAVDGASPHPNRSAAPC